MIFLWLTLFHFLGIEEIRKDKQGKDLPNPRKITRMLVTSKKHPSSRISTFFAAFGQFVDHDLTKTPIFKGENPHEFLNCCKVFPLAKV